MKCFYHHDNDGKCAAAIVSLYTKNNNINNFIEMDHDQEVPLERVNENETVYIVDFSFFPETMDELLKITRDVHWIDHHVSAIKRFDGYHTKIRGIRNEGEEAGCLLTWNYMFPDKEAPEFVKLVSDRDVWEFKYGDRTRYMFAYTELADAGIDFWTWLFENPDHLDGYIEVGKHCYEYRAKLCEKQIKDNSYEIGFHGHRCLVLNTSMYGAEMFDSVRDKYDICIMSSYNGEKWRVSMYSAKVDTHEIAMMYGGGGHPGASGFTVDELPYEFHDPIEG